MGFSCKPILSSGFPENEEDRVETVRCIKEWGSTGAVFDGFPVREASFTPM